MPIVVMGAGVPAVLAEDVRQGDPDGHGEGACEVIVQITDDLKPAVEPVPVVSDGQRHRRRRG